MFPSQSMSCLYLFFLLDFFTGEYIPLDPSELSASGVDAEDLPPSADEEKTDQEESDAFPLDKAFGFVDFDEVSLLHDIHLFSIQSYDLYTSSPGRVPRKSNTIRKKTLTSSVDYLKRLGIQVCPVLLFLSKKREREKKK